MLSKIKAGVYTPEASPLAREDTFTDAERLTEVVKGGRNFAWEKKGNEGKVGGKVSNKSKRVPEIWSQVHKR